MSFFESPGFSCFSFLAALIIGTRAHATNSIRELRGQVYKHLATQDLTADVFLPESADAISLRPAVIVVHGGAWTHRSGDMEWICQDLARSGFVALNITYRLAPEFHFPDPVIDVRDAVSWLKKNAARFGVDPNRIAGWGYSAGANLVLLAGLDPQTGFKALVSGGTPADLTLWPQSPLVKKFIGQDYEDARELWADASPVNHIQSNSPPVFLYHGEWDWIVNPEQERIFTQALSKKGVRFESYIAPWMGHLWVYLFSRESFVRGRDFLKRAL